MPIALIVLAAGQGTRMQSDRPKVLHELAGAPLLVHALRAGAALAPERIVVVAGHGADEVEAALAEADQEAHIVRQAEQRGTADAVCAAAGALADFAGDAMVLYGDTPLIRPQTLMRMIEARQKHDIVLLAFRAADPGRYGRLLTTGDSVDRIVEFKDATEAERAIDLCNSGVMAADCATLLSLAAQVGCDNAAGEFYLTDIVGIARRKGLSVTAIICDEEETLGVNTRAELARAEAVFQQRARTGALNDGVTLVAPQTVFFAYDTVIGRDAVVEPHVVFGPGVTVETGARIRAFSHLEGCHVARGAVVGPHARLRHGAEIAEDARIGNFVEIKNAAIGQAAKVSHLSYVGDAQVGAGANIGAGTVTCNYDGVSKHRTEIGPRAFIGSDTMLVAPVRVGAEAMTGSGSVITQDVPEGALAIARARQVNLPGRARKLMALLRRNRTER